MDPQPGGVKPIMVGNSDSQLIRVDRLRSFSEDVFMKCGLSTDHSKIVADSLIYADLCGIHSHGVSRIRSYLDRVDAGTINPRPDIKILRSFGAITLIDGDDGPGQVSASHAMNLAIEGARNHGISMCGVVNGGHIGALAYWTSMALQHGMIGICVSNGTALMPPWGASESALGNMPLSISAPAGNHLPLILDLALSVTARGNIILASKRGEKIPLGWALNKEGVPTDDPQDALEGSVLPIAGYKGSGLAIMAETLCAVLLGGKLSHECGGLAPNELDKKDPLGFNNIYCCINIEAFDLMEKFIQRCDKMIDYLKRLPIADGHNEILMPGEIQIRMARERNLSGVLLEIQTINELKVIAEKFNLNLEI